MFIIGAKLAVIVGIVHVGCNRCILRIAAMIVGVIGIAVGIAAIMLGKISITVGIMCIIVIVGITVGIICIIAGIIEGMMRILMVGIIVILEV